MQRFSTSAVPVMKQLAAPVRPANANSDGRAAEPLGAVKFSRAEGARICVPAGALGNVPATRKRKAGRHDVLVRDARMPTG